MNAKPLSLARGSLGAMVILVTFAAPAMAQNTRQPIVQTSGHYCPNCQHADSSGYTDSSGYCDACQGQGGCNHCRGRFGRTRISATSYARPPVLPPIRRYSKVYTRYWADHVTRDSGPAVRTAAYPSFPMIHTPTDTTQLGYTYVHVPYFHFRPEMLPPAPGPSWGTAAHCPRSGYTTYDSSGFFGGSTTEIPPGAPGNPLTPQVTPTPIQNHPPVNPPAARPEPTPVEGNPAVQNVPAVVPQAQPQPEQYFTGGKS